MKFAVRLLPMLGALTLASNLVYGQDNLPDRTPPLNTVKLQLSAEAWASTQTAKVSVAVNASLNEGELAKIYGQIQTNLNKLADKADWHITAFNRSQDQSGLEKVTAQAEARIPQNTLTGLRDKAKALSKPGNTITIENIEFTPSLQETDAVKLRLRENIYQQAQTELAALNKAYPDQQYFLHSVNFLPTEVAPMPMGRAMMATDARGSEEAMPNLSINNKMNVTATVILASKPKKE